MVVIRKTNLEPVLHMRRKTLDQSITLNSTLFDDDDMQFEAKPNTTYVIYINPWWDAHSDGDAQCAIAIPSGIAFRIASFWHDGGGSSSADATTAVPMFSTTGLFHTNPMQVLVEVAGTGGTIAFQWAQRASAVQPCIFKAGSFMTWQEGENL